MFPSRGASALLQDPDPAWLDGVAHLHAPAYALDRDPARTAVLAPAARRQGSGRDDVGRRLRHRSPRAARACPGPPSCSTTWRPTGSSPTRTRERCWRPRGATSWLAPAHALVVKRGPSPTVVHRPGQAPVEVPVAPVAVVRDTTGCGDAFAAAFLTEVLRGGSVGGGVPRRPRPRRDAADDTRRRRLTTEGPPDGQPCPIDRSRPPFRARLPVRRPSGSGGGGQQPLALGDEPLTQRPAELGEAPLRGGVLLLALGGLDRGTGS